MQKAPVQYRCYNFSSSELHEQIETFIMVQANFHSFETLTFEHLLSPDFLLAAYGTHSFWLSLE